MKRLFKIIGIVTAVLAAVAGILFAIYYWDLDQKLLNWIRSLEKKISERGKRD